MARPFKKKYFFCGFPNDNDNNNDSVPDGEHQAIGELHALVQPQLLRDRQVGDPEYSTVKTTFNRNCSDLIASYCTSVRYIWMEIRRMTETESFMKEKQREIELHDGEIEINRKKERQKVNEIVFIFLQYSQVFYGKDDI